MADYSQIFDLIGQGANLYGSTQNANVNNQNAAAVGSQLGQNQSTLAQQIAALQGQIGQGGQDAQAAYDRARGLYDTENQGLQQNIDTMTSNLNALNDPNSPYMQMMRQRLERSDAAAGRRSQVGEREVQLAAMLADYIGKYAPGLNNSITAARNQIAGNQNSLATMYSQMNNANTQRQATLNDLIRQQQQGAVVQNQTGRGAAQGANNSNMAAIQSALGIGKGLYNMFSGGGLGEGNNGQSYWTGGQGGLSQSDALNLWSSPNTSWNYGGSAGGSGGDSYNGDPYGGDYSGGLFDDNNW